MIDARIHKAFPAGRDSAGFTLDIQLKTSARLAVLFGPSGSGKSLTLDAIAGFMEPDAGRILVDDVLLFDADSGAFIEPCQRRCGYVVQHSALFPHMTLRENLAFAAKGETRLERRRKVGLMLERFRLRDAAGRRPSQLSGGQRQRGSIARALLAAPRLLLLDEPASGLDSLLKEELYALLEQVREEFNIPILLVTHSLDEAMALGDEMFVVSGGRIVESGASAALLDHPASEECAALLGPFNVLEGEILALDPAAKSSRLRCTTAGGASFDCDGPYFPGHLLGARLKLACSAEALRVRPGPGPGVVLQLQHSSRRSRVVRLEFAGGVVAEVPARDFDMPVRAGEWTVEFPATAWRALR